MKKSTLNIIILALVLVNVVLSVILTFSLVTTSRKTDALITKIAALIDLDIATDSGSSGSSDNPGINDIEVIDVMNGESDKITISISDTAGKSHFAVVSGTLTLNKKSKDYEKYRASIDTNMKLIAGTVSSVMSGYSFENLLSQKENIAKQITLKLQDTFKSDIIYNFSFVNYQLQ